MSGLRDQLTLDLDCTFKSLEETIQHTSELFLNLPSPLVGIVSPDVASKVVDFRAQVSSIREVIARRHLKVAFFGRTSCGKSSIINALLGSEVLPMGLGHTTTKFVHVQGTDQDSAYVENNEDVDIDKLDQVQEKSIKLYWPKSRCSLFKNDDIVLIDSPGVDVDDNFDHWIDEECADADLFILVLNSESTLMMREKSFFHAVSRKIAKPNILILFNRWDCSEGELNIGKVKDQHLQRAAEFLAHELKIVQTEEEGKKLVFFVSAKEILEKKGNQERLESWRQFCEFIEMCMNNTDQGCRYWPFIQSGKQVAVDLDNIQARINQKAKRLFYEKSEEKIQIKEKIKHQKSLLMQEKMTEDLDKMLDHVDSMTLDTYQQVLEDHLPQIVMDFQPSNSITNQEDFVKTVKKDLLVQVEHDLAECLKSNLSLQLINYIQNRQYCLQQSLHHVQDHKLEPYLDFPSRFDLLDEHFIEEPVHFQFSLSPKSIQDKYFKGKKMFPFLNSIGETWSSRLKILITAAAVINESQLAIAGLALKCFGSSRTGIRIATSMALIYCSLYLLERTIWALSGKEKQIKLCILSFASDKLNTLRSCITSSMKTQVEYQMKSFMDSLQANLKAQHLELQEAMETIDDESDGIQFVIKSCANLSNSLQGVLFDFDAFERTLWTRMEHAKSPAKTN